MGAGSRIVEFDEAAELGLPIVGYLAYDHVARLEPTVPLPEDGRDFPESRLIVCETLVRFDHGITLRKIALATGLPEEQLRSAAFSDLERAIPGLSQKMLTQQLRQLES